MAPPPAVEFELTEPEYVKGLQRLIRRNRSLVGLAALSPLAANRLGNIVARRLRLAR